MHLAVATLLTLFLFGNVILPNHVKSQGVRDVEAEIIHTEEVVKLGKRVGYKLKISFVNNTSFKLKAKYSVYLGDEDLDTKSLPQAWLQMNRILKSGYKFYVRTDSVTLYPKEEVVVTMMTGITWTPRGSQEQVIVDSVDRL